MTQKTSETQGKSIEELLGSNIGDLEELGIAPETLRCWCRAKKIEHFRLGGRLSVTRAEIESVRADSRKPRVANG